MNNLPYFLAVYTIVFVALFVYTWLLSSRQKRLERKLDELREQLKDSHLSK